MTKSKKDQDKEERARDAAQATAEYHAEGLAVREKTARLKGTSVGQGGSQRGR